MNRKNFTFLTKYIIKRKEEDIYENFIKKLKKSEIDVFLTNKKIENKFKQIFKNYKISVVDEIDSKDFGNLSKILKITSNMNNIKINEIDSLKFIKIDVNKCRIYLKINDESPYCSVILKSNSKEMLKEIFL